MDNHFGWGASSVVERLRGGSEGIEGNAQLGGLDGPRLCSLPGRKLGSWSCISSGSANRRAA